MILDYSKAYKDVREVLEHPVVQKALEFAAKHPDAVYIKDSLEYNSVVHDGFFDLYLSISPSTAEDDGA